MESPAGWHGRIARAVLVAALLTGPLHAGADTALDRYVRAPDPAYQYRPVGVLEGRGFRAHLLEMTSQTWRTADEVDLTVWKHWLTVIIPQDVRHDAAFLYLSGGRATDPPPAEADERIAHIAVQTGSVAAVLRQVPQQPLTFAGEKEPRREDLLIAYAWDKFLRTGDATWLPRLPMTKSAVRAMDTIVDYCARPESGSRPIESFVVGGSSKRGWTAWTTAAVDSRVIAIVPMVIDLLNLERTFVHHYRAYGSWSPAIQPFIDLDIPWWFGSREFRELRRIEDPYSYRDRLTLPKLIINATGDPFFLPDSSRFYFADLRGESHLRYVPNADHSLNGTDAFDSVLAFFGAIAGGASRPEFTWRFQGETSIRVRTDPVKPPTEVRLWEASNAEARDFRLETIGPAWRATLLAPRGNGIYVGRVARPARGWAAFFVELTYPVGGSEPLKLTTAVRVVPDDVPHGPP
jgi:PhoPQ-activated pathogenicity-related protein